MELTMLESARSSAASDMISEASSQESARSVRFDMNEDVKYVAPVKAERDTMAAPSRFGLQRSSSAGSSRQAAAWRSGMRVTTNCTLTASMSKAEHPPGPGRVWKVLEDGVLLVALDNDACKTVLVSAEPHDLTVNFESLPVQTTVRARGLVIMSPSGPYEIPAEAVGEVLCYNEACNTYDIAYWGLEARVAVPSRVVQALQLPPAYRRRRQPSRMRASTKALFAKLSVHLPRLGRGDVPAATSPAMTCTNLQKEPSYSNIRGSPRGTYRTRGAEDADHPSMVSLLRRPPFMSNGAQGEHC